MTCESISYTRVRGHIKQKPPSCILPIMKMREGGSSVVRLKGDYFTITLACLPERST